MPHLLLALLLLSATAHAAPSPRPSPAPIAKKKPLFERLGGKPGVARISSEFVDVLMADKRLLANAQIAEIAKKTDKPKTKNLLTERICKDTGGPCKAPYPVIQNPPKDMKLKTMEWFFVMQDANTALDRAKVPLQEQKELIGMLIKAQQGS